MSNFNSKFNVNDFLSKAKNNPNEVKSENEVNDFINKNLNENQAKEVRDILSDQDKMKKMLGSKEAKKLFKELFGGKNNG